MASGGESGEIRHSGACHEATSTLWSETEQFAQPGERYLLESCCHRRHHAERAVLIPDSGEPVGGQRGGQGSAGYESEIPSAGGHHGRGRPVVVEQGQDVPGIGWPVRNWTGEMVEAGDLSSSGCDGSPPGTGCVELGTARGLVQQVFHEWIPKLRG